MSRIEEIKETLGHAKTVGLTYDEGEGYARDVDYLLSRLEIAEKALEVAKDKTALAVNKMCGGSVKKPIFEDARAAYYAINEALQQIRS